MKKTQLKRRRSGLATAPCSTFFVLKDNVTDTIEALTASSLWDCGRGFRLLPSLRKVAARTASISPFSNFNGTRNHRETELAVSNPVGVQMTCCLFRWVLSVGLLTASPSYHPIPRMSKKPKLKSAFIMIVLSLFGLVNAPAHHGQGKSFHIIIEG